MKCPSCESKHYHIYEHDPDLMMCDQCHTIHSKTWSLGYWIGHIDGERKAREDLLVWAKERYTEEVNGRSLGNIHREILDTTWQQIIDKLDEKIPL